MTKPIKCPYCGRTLYGHERYCWFCERDVSKARDAAEKPRCFVATSVFGKSSYEVAVLREFRDDVLNKNFFGKTFVHVYYKISPVVARTVDKNEIIKNFFKKLIRIFVKFIEK